MPNFERIPLAPVDRVEITTLVDNQWDMLLQSTDRAQRPSMSPNGRPLVEAPFFLDPHLPEMLVAEHGSVVVVPEGHERAFLRGTSVSLLSFEPEIPQRLRALSLDTLGAIAALPRPAIEAQFRTIGGRMWDLANGIDETPLIPRRTPEAITEHLTFESPV